MAASKVSICNMALSRIGVSAQISSLDEASNEAVVCKLFYEQCRDEVLRDHHWSFAKRLVGPSLVGSADDDPEPVWAKDWAYAYRYPSDCVAARRISTSLGRNPGVPPRFEVGSDASGRLIYADVEKAVLEYTAVVDDPVRYDPLFVSALAWKLAHEIAMPLSASDRFREQAGRAYLLVLSQAKAQDGNERQQDEEPESQFVRARE